MIIRSANIRLQISSAAPTDDPDVRLKALNYTLIYSKIKNFMTGEVDVWGMFKD